MAKKPNIAVLGDVFCDIEGRLYDVKHHPVKVRPCVLNFDDLVQCKGMTKLLEEAIEQLRDLPEEEQDAAADVLFAYMSSDAREYQLQPHQVAEVHRIRRGLRDGSIRLATDVEVKAVRQKVRSCDCASRLKRSLISTQSGFTLRIVVRWLRRT